MHGAAADVDAGRIEADSAADAIATTALAAFTPPGGTVPTIPIGQHP
jgi:hypothetical protein